MSLILCVSFHVAFVGFELWPSKLFLVARVHQPRVLVGFDIGCKSFLLQCEQTSQSLFIIFILLIVFNISFDTARWLRALLLVHCFSLCLESNEPSTDIC